ENRVERVTRSSAAAPSLLAGLVYDEAGERMSPTHANKKGTRYRYYVSQSLIRRGRSKASPAVCRVPAADLEALVEERVCTLLRDDAAIFDAASTGTTSIATRETLVGQAVDLATRWPALALTERRTVLQILVVRIDVRTETVDITLRPRMLANIL